MTTNTIIARARRIIDDSVELYRWSDEEMREDFQSALRRLNSLAPHTRYLPDGTTVDYVALPEDDDAVLPVNDKYDEALALYVAYLCYHNDATDTVNAERASSCLTRAESLMI